MPEYRLKDSVIVLRSIPSFVSGSYEPGSVRNLTIAALLTFITASVGMNWRSYGLNQSWGQLPRRAVTLIVHLASVWVPFTSESKEAIASYPEIQKELRLALQSVGRKLGMYMKRREKVKHEGERRSIFMRYLGEVAMAVSGVNDMSRQELFDALVASAKRKTATADVLLGEDGMPIEEENFGENVIVVA